ncbi:hypothetical protein vBAbaMPhT2_242 [Acinetobacter phage vB_AbaM_PhT2]|uniref:Uncharacterized protein n=2 Tax=Hadassahvirus TaxID=2842716 RepID=A0A6B9SZE6_9CAUD|nr:hypothetical protein HYP74_gp203 [Acinetobacter phage AbTZA1]YP_009887253.1 hypothetical protein HYQ24_gp196 [Acinetobacter phage vB_AbaM_PhT2]QQM13833.1 hypothetical protein CPT_Maestro_099 [Acinetobacter phage Maestro]QQM18589.1 hypothetical protein CPT_Morttis_096 [Acinetobacter phage Morttis]QQO96296.1 hypothetical protein CPT_Minot_093 [Acinetobacter phage Minot]QQO96544.1 hypothetical protein CPT_Mokit_093 [Acinetobacter phage Mokit]QQO96799.1 hypothetical protein CPT_Melin_098 [Acin
MSANKAEFIATIIIAVIILAIASVWSMASEYISCKSYESNTGRTVKYSLITGCYVKTDKDNWVPREEMTKSAVVESK